MLQQNLNDIEIRIPDRLGDVVDGSLREVHKLHRRRTVRRAGATLGGVMAFVGAFLILGFTNPALAAQIPFLGNIFREASDKTVPIARGVEDYGLVREIDVQAQTDSPDCALRAIEAYSDGRLIQLGLELTAPEELAEQYDYLESEGCGTASVNGEEAGLDNVLRFTKQEGKWIAILRLTVPESQREANPLNVEYTLQELEAQQYEGNESEELPGSFVLSLAVTPDRAYTRQITEQAENGGAKVLAVDAGPAQTILTVEKPGWGYAIENAEPGAPDSYAAGFPYLYTEDGTEISYHGGDSADLGGYDYKSLEPQTADLYFDGVPVGTEKLIFRFLKGDGKDPDKVLAEFTIDLTAGTVSTAE